VAKHCCFFFLVSLYHFNFFFNFLWVFTDKLLVASNILCYEWQSPFLGLPYQPHRGWNLIQEGKVCNIPIFEQFSPKRKFLACWEMVYSGASKHICQEMTSSSKLETSLAVTVTEGWRIKCPSPAPLSRGSGLLVCKDVIPPDPGMTAPRQVQHRDWPLKQSLRLWGVFHWNNTLY
jgi:hypothetical protein